MVSGPGAYRVVEESTPMRPMSRGRAGGFALLSTAVCSIVGSVVLATPAAATPVCTDGYMGGPPRELCGGRVFPEASNAVGYVQYMPAPGTGFKEYQHGLEYLAQLYPRFVKVHKLSDLVNDPKAITVGLDEIRPDEEGETGDGNDILVVEVTDFEAPKAGKQALFFSLSIHGNERGGLEGGLRVAEDLAREATEGGTIVDGVANYTSVVGKTPLFHEYEVGDVLKKQVLYFADFNIDGWTVGDLFRVPPAPFARGNGMGTDLNRQFPTIGRIDVERNPLQEPEAKAAYTFLTNLAASQPGGRFAHGADIHGELNSGAYVDIMYPAGEFDPLEHRRMMTIAERTKSVIDDTLFEGIINEIEEATGGNEEPSPIPGAVIPTKPAQWATVWDSLGYTDSGFLGDYLATDLAVTGLDHEIFLNHTVPDKVWTVALQENHINATRAMIRTAMAYALTQDEDYTAANTVIPTGGRAGYIFNPAVVTDSDANGPGTLPGPEKNGIGADGKPVVQRPYSATPMKWFTDSSKYFEHGLTRVNAGTVAAGGAGLDVVDSLVLADAGIPADADGKAVDKAKYVANLKSWIEKGGNLVLTDKAIHLLGDLGLVPAEAIDDIGVYQPFVDITDFASPLVERLRPNARQLVEAPILGYEIGDEASPMTTVAEAAFTAAGGAVVGTSNDGVSLGELRLGAGRIVILGGALPYPTEENDHRYGLRNYAPTYTATFILENALKWDVPGLGNVAAARGDAAPASGQLPSTGTPIGDSTLLLAVAALAMAVIVRRGTPRRRSRAN